MRVTAVGLVAQEPVSPYTLMHVQPLLAVSDEISRMMVALDELEGMLQV